MASEREDEDPREEGKGREGEQDVPPAEKSGDQAEESEFSRRALVQSGWSVPVIVAVASPSAMLSICGHVDNHHVDDDQGSNSNHADSPHHDLHATHNDTAHSVSHGDHSHFDEKGATHGSRHFDHGVHNDVTLHGDAVLGNHLDALGSHFDVVHKDGGGTGNHNDAAAGRAHHNDTDTAHTDYDSGTGAHVDGHAGHGDTHHVDGAGNCHTDISHTDQGPDGPGT